MHKGKAGTIIYKVLGVTEPTKFWYVCMYMYLGCTVFSAPGWFSSRTHVDTQSKYVQVFSARMCGA